MVDWWVWSAHDAFTGEEKITNVVGMCGGERLRSEPGGSGGGYRVVELNSGRVPMMGRRVWGGLDFTRGDSR